MIFLASLKRIGSVIETVRVAEQLGPQESFGKGAIGILVWHV